MPSPGPGDDPPDGPTTRAEFEAALADLLRFAYLNDVEIGSGVDLRYPGDVPDWEVQITPLRKPRDR